MSASGSSPVEDIELLPPCEGAAEPAPGLLYEIAPAKDLSAEMALTDLAGWISLTALSGVIGNSAYAAIRQKVLDVVAAFRRDKGQAKVIDLKQQVSALMHQHRPNGKLSPEQLQARIDAFFNEVQG